MAGATILLSLGCAQPPTEQLGAAQQTIDVAKAAGAAEYAKEDFVALEQQFALAKNELTKQKNVLPIFRSYTDADKMLRTVVESGGRVATKAAQGKEAAQTAVLVMGQEAGNVVASVKELIAQVPTGKARAAVEPFKQDLEGLETSFHAVQLLIEMGDYFGAEIQANAVKEEGATVSREIQGIIDTAKGKKITSNTNIPLRKSPHKEVGHRTKLN
ncbi:MAG: hypothetical protein NT179_00030 [Nitrospirae bacterium]|nr:hypothetical protein [Nitrospirota bacterium]